LGLFHFCFSQLSNHSNNIIYLITKKRRKKINMKTLKIAAAIAVLAIVVVGASIASVYAFGWGMRTQTQYAPYAAPNAGTPVNQYYAPVTQTNTTVPTLYTPTQVAASQYGTGYGWGGCMGGGRWGWGPNSYRTTTTVTSINISQATGIAQTYVASLNNADLKVTQVEEYQNNFYVAVGEKSTGNGAFELLINKVTGIVTPEMGPNMMWNTKYTFGMGWCNWARGAIAGTPTVTADQAKTGAQQYLNSYIAETTTGDITAFPGYYTIEVLNNGSPYGMLSVNAFTGQVWYHTWHGAFIQEAVVS
jgi:hypothetical protein